MKTHDEFFIPDNEVKLSDELDYNKMDEYFSATEITKWMSGQNNLNITALGMFPLFFGHPIVTVA